MPAEEYSTHTPDVGLEGKPMNRIEPYQYLPLYARLAVEWVDNHYSDRRADVAIARLHDYAQAYGVAANDIPREYEESVLHHCRARFPNFEG